MPKINAPKGVLNATTAAAYLKRKCAEFGAESAHDLAMKTGVEPTFLNDMSRGVRNPTAINIVDVAKRLNDNPHDLLTALTGVPPREVGPLENQLLSLWWGTDEVTREMLLDWLRGRLQRK